MASRRLTNLLLIILTLGILGHLAWTIYRDQQASKAAQRVQEEQHQAEMAVLRGKIWDTAAHEDLVWQLEKWLKQQTGKSAVDLDYVFTRQFRGSDVTWSGKREAMVSGILTVRAGKESNPAFYVQWSRPVRLNDRAVWVADYATLQRIPDPPEAGQWHVKVLLDPLVIRRGGIQ